MKEIADCGLRIADSAGQASGPVLSVDDLATRWRAPGKTPGARRKYVWRRVHAWGLPYAGERNALFGLRAVVSAETRWLGK